MCGESAAGILRAHKRAEVVVAGCRQELAGERVPQQQLGQMCLGVLGARAEAPAERRLGISAFGNCCMSCGRLYAWRRLDVTAFSEVAEDHPVLV